LFDATGIYTTADPYYCVGDWGTPTCDGTDPNWFDYRWTGTSEYTIPPVRAFVSNLDVSAVTVRNTEWGFNVDASVTVTAIANDGRTVIDGSDTVTFFVGEPGEFNLPPTAGTDEVAWMLADDPDTLTFDVLANDSDPEDANLFVTPATGTWSIDG